MGDAGLIQTPSLSLQLSSSSSSSPHSRPTQTEVVIRDDYYREALEILQMYCSLLLTRSGLLDSKPTLDESLKEAVCTLLWCAPRLAVDLREINEVKKQLGLRFGKELLEEARMSDCPGVSKRIVRKLSVAVPPHNIVVGYMQAIASTYNVPWKEAWNKEAPVRIRVTGRRLGGPRQSDERAKLVKLVSTISTHVGKKDGRRAE